MTLYLQLFKNQLSKKSAWYNHSTKNCKKKHPHWTINLQKLNQVDKREVSFGYCQVHVCYQQYYEGDRIISKHFLTDKFKRTKPTVVQLARGSVEDGNVKGHDYCLKITSTLQGEKIIFLSFRDAQEFNRWYRKCKKVPDIHLLHFSPW